MERSIWVGAYPRFLAMIAGLALVLAGCQKNGGLVVQPARAAAPAANETTPAASEESAQPAAAPTDGKSAVAKPEKPETAPPSTANGDDSQLADPAANSDQQATKAPRKDNAEKNDPDAPVHPFVQRVPVPDFPKDMEWLNVAGPLRKQDLQGKFVLLDFWTYCCINCIHILPELKKLEQAYPNELVVIGVHSAKFETEKGTKNIEEAILRYEIEHPVVNDADHKIWDTFGVRSWPTIILIDPEGNAVWGRPGEFKFEEVDEILKTAIPYYRQQKILDETPIQFDLAARRQQATPLRFPGKVLADEPGNRLFISDSNHNRIVVTDLDGKLLEIIGSGVIGRSDGDFSAASFDHPQGMTLHKNVLYVADTENHMLRKVDLEKKQVTTIAGTGEQGKGWPGIDKLRAGDSPPSRWVGPPATTELNSPWDLWVHGSDLYIAMAGPHQIWKMPLDESEIGPYAGNGREDIVDGPLLPRIPYEQGFSSFAQPSGLSSDGEWLYVADSEGSSIRAVPFDPTREVKTVVGTAELPFNRLFHFGDQDGERDEVLLQHCLGVAYLDGKLYVADTYNNKIKTVDPKTGATKTLAGTGQPGKDDGTGEFDEPSGLTFAKGRLYVADTNNHLIRTVDPATGKVATLEIAGLQPPQVKQPPRKPDFSRAPKVDVDETAVSLQDGKLTLQVAIELPAGWKMNPLATMRYWTEATQEQGPLDRDSLGEQVVSPPAKEFSIPLAASGAGSDQLRVAVVYYYCQDGNEGLCKVGSVVWNVPLRIAAEGSPAQVSLKYQVPE